MYNSSRISIPRVTTNHKILRIKYGHPSKSLVDGGKTHPFQSRHSSSLYIRPCSYLSIYPHILVYVSTSRGGIAGPKSQNGRNPRFSPVILSFSGMKVGISEIIPCVTSFPDWYELCLLYTSPSPRDKRQSRMPSSA